MEATDCLVGSHTGAGAQGEELLHEQVIQALYHKSWRAGVGMPDRQKDRQFLLGLAEGGSQRRKVVPALGLRTKYNVQAIASKDRQNWRPAGIMHPLAVSKPHRALVAESRIRTGDLQVMGLTSYLAAPSRIDTIPQF